MMYKDKDKQREANREASQRRRDRKGMTQKMSNEGMTVGNGNANVIPSSKRGKDIKVFEDLPVDVQQTINRMSLVDGKTDDTVKANRTAIAINYQHTFGAGAYYPHGAVCAGVVSGEYSFKTVKGKVEDVHRIEPRRPP